MSEKRRLSTRNRGEPPLKKRAYTPTPPPAPRPAAPPRAVEPVVQGLPTKLAEGRPLPTLPEPQNADLSAKAFQTISESAVLAASIDRSRQKWLTDGIFDRYWAKPSKKRPIAEAQNPAKESMSKLGPCSMIIEPHVFDITLYTVKENTSVQRSSNPHPPSLSATHYRPYPPATAYPPPTYNGPFTGTHQSQDQQPNTLQASIPSFKEQRGPHDSQVPPAPYYASQPAVTHPVSSEPPYTPRSNSTGREGSPNRNGDPQSDPVIQMLATRAASDHGLKTLMKVVASGNASPKQLKEFQNHIDELNSILKTRHSQNVPFRDNATKPNSSAATASASLPSAADSRSPVPPGHLVDFERSVPLNTAGIAIKSESTPHYYTPAPPPPKPKPLASYKPDIQAVVFDFGGVGDRYSFPIFSILEYLPGSTQVLVSFLIIRRGNMAVSSKYKDTKSYYQPITIRLSTQNPRILEPLARVVAPPDDVRRYMDSVFDKTSPAENVYLATRLPRTKDLEEVEKQEHPVQADDSLIKATYSPPDSIVPLAA